MIRKFLGEPDKLSQNPHYSCASPMRLYVLDRVIKIEETLEFQEQLFISKRKSIISKKVAKKVVETKTKELCDFVLEETEIYFPEVSKEKLIKKACKHYNDYTTEWLISRKKSFEDFVPATPKSDIAFLKRITINYLRHVCSDYEEVLDLTTGKVGKDEAYYMLRDKITETIYNKYSWLK